MSEPTIPEMLQQMQNMSPKAQQKVGALKAAFLKAMAEKAMQPKKEDD